MVSWAGWLRGPRGLKGLAYFLTALTVSNQALAVPTITLSKMDGATATLEVVIPRDILETRRNLHENFAKFLMAGHSIRDAVTVRWPEENEFAREIKTVKSIDRHYERSVTIKPAASGLIGDALLFVKEERHDCLTSDCTPNVEYTLSGPRYIYEMAIEAATPLHTAQAFTVRLKAEPTSLEEVKKDDKKPNRDGTADGSTSVKPVKPSMANSMGPVAPTASTQPVSGTKLTVELKVNYHDASVFFRQLHRLGRLNFVPVQEEIQREFLLWAHSAVRHFSW